jgi:hypothetical protein
MEGSFSSPDCAKASTGPTGNAVTMLRRTVRRQALIPFDWVVDALRLLVRYPRADLSAVGRAAFKERIHGRRRRREAAVALGSFGILTRTIVFLATASRESAGSATGRNGAPGPRTWCG